MPKRLNAAAFFYTAGVATWTNVSKLAFIKNMKRLLHEIMQWSLFSYIKIPPRLRFLGFRCGKAASAS